jgi:hypothetical protein
MERPTATLTLGTEIVRDERGRIVDTYVLCVASPAPAPLAKCVLRALASRARLGDASRN